MTATYLRASLATARDASTDSGESCALTVVDKVENLLEIIATTLQQ